MDSSCAKFQMLLSAYVDGELAGRELGHVETHLGGCADCRARVEDLKVLGRSVNAALMQQAEEVDFSGFADRVLKEITPERPGLLERLRVSWNELLDHHRAAVFSAAAAAAVALLVAVPATWYAARSGGAEQIAAVGELPDAVVIQDLRLDDPNVQPVVVRGENGRVMIMLVERPGSGAGQAEPLRLNTTPPSGGDL
ncbi:MAG: anti-sigma factor family protein [Myxococcales bacterium]